MFTGLIEEVGILRSIEPFYDGLRITIYSRFVVESLKIGDSVAVDGVCQTVTDRTDDIFTVEAVGETLAKTTFRNFRQGKKVNLERSMPADGRFDGHLVLGHVEGTGRIIRLTDRGNHLFIEIAVPEGLRRNIVLHGSVALDGVSLTVAAVSSGRMGISIIPHTVQNCTLGERKTGDIVNIETDALGRYVDRQLYPEKNELSESVLRKWGY